MLCEEECLLYLLHFFIPVRVEWNPSNNTTMRVGKKGEQGREEVYSNRVPNLLATLSIHGVNQFSVVPLRLVTIPIDILPFE